MIKSSVFLEIVFLLKKRVFLLKVIKNSYNKIFYYFIKTRQNKFENKYSKT